MEERFSGSEVVQLGVEIEINGKDFYNTLANQTQNKDAKDVFIYLADEEEKHITAFQKIFDSVKKYEPPEAYPGDYFAYMNALAREHVFTQKNKGTEIAKDIKNDLEAIELGIGFEKDSIVFFEGMKKAVPEEDQKIIDELIKQEQVHLTKLDDLRRIL